MACYNAASRYSRVNAPQLVSKCHESSSLGCDLSVSFDLWGMGVIINSATLIANVKPSCQQNALPKHNAPQMRTSF